MLSCVPPGSGPETGGPKKAFNPAGLDESGEDVVVFERANGGDLGE